MADSPEKKWQDHPVIIAIVSGAATLVFAYNVLFPTLTASLQNEVTSLRSQVQEIGELKSRVAAIEAAAKIDKVKLAEAQTTNFLSLGNPYPIGLGKIKIGNTRDSILATYPEASIDREKRSRWSTKQDHATVSGITYYFDEDPKTPHVRALLVHVHSISAELLHSRLLEALGQPSSAGPKKNCYIWILQGDVVVKEYDSGGYSIDATPQNCNLD